MEEGLRKEQIGPVGGVSGRWYLGRPPTRASLQSSSTPGPDWRGSRRTEETPRKDHPGRENPCPSIGSRRDTLGGAQT